MKVNTEKAALKGNYDKIKILAKGVDSLYLYLDCGELIGWEYFLKEVEKYAYDEPFKLRGLSFVRVKA